MRKNVQKQELHGGTNDSIINIALIDAGEQMFKGGIIVQLVKLN